TFCCFLAWPYSSPERLLWLRACSSADCCSSDGGNRGRAPPRAERRNPALVAPRRGFAIGHVGCWRPSRDGGSGMTLGHHRTDFICPGCGADYKVVRVKAEADPPHRLIHCKVCKRSLAPTDREYILKYFLIRQKQAAKQRV